MQHTLTTLLSAGAVAAALSAVPAAAQVAGNPGDLHTPTQYTQRYDYAPHTGPGYPGYGYNYPAGEPSLFSGIFAPVGFLASGFGAVVGAPAYVVGGTAPAYAAAQPGCRAFQDFNGRRTAICGP